MSLWRHSAPNFTESYIFWKFVYLTIKLVIFFILCRALFFNIMWGQFCTLTPLPLLKISGGVKQLTCSPTSGSELFHARERCTVRHSCQAHQSWICGYVHVYKIIKQLFHACSGNSQNHCPSVLKMTCCWPRATVLNSSPAPRDNACSGNSQN